MWPPNTPPPLGPAGSTRSARRDHHAGEPLVRLLFRHVSRAPTGSRCRTAMPTVCIPTRDAGCVRAVPRHRRPQCRRPARHRQCDRATSTAARWTGFSRAARARSLPCLSRHRQPRLLADAPSPDVMGYHDWHEIPNYWAYARNFVLQDHMFESDTLLEPAGAPLHGLRLVGRCSKHGDPMSCTSALKAPGSRADGPAADEAPDYAWTDLTYLLHTRSRQLALLRREGQRARLRRRRRCSARTSRRARRRPSIWNPLPCFDTVQQDHQLGNIQPLDNFFSAARKRARCRRSRGSPRRRR